MSVSRVLTANGEVYYVLSPRNTVHSKAILWHHGAGGETLLYSPEFGQIQGRALMEMLVEAGYCIVSADYGGSQTWGNTANQAKITAAVDWLPAIGCRTDKVAFWGTSMGFTCVAKWVATHPTKVAALVGTIPCADAAWVYANSNGNPTLATAMDAAYSPGSWASAAASTNPSSSAIYMPIATNHILTSLWYSSDDLTIGSTTAPNFANLVNSNGGSATATSMGTGGHTDSPLAAINRNAFALAFHNGNWA
ncbi:MAG: hypothetical protein WBP26_05070 [Candidatus Saccharimonadales bacterium]